MADFPSQGLTRKYAGAGCAGCALNRATADLFNDSSENVRHAQTITPRVGQGNAGKKTRFSASPPQAGPPTASKQKQRARSTCMEGHFLPPAGMNLRLRGKRDPLLHPSSLLSQRSSG